MSLSKQLLILISFIFFVIFAVNFILSTANIKSYLEIESEVHMQDTATSLGLALSPHMIDNQDPIIRTMINAIFDQGYYKEIRLVDIDGRNLISLKNTDKPDGVPQWLINLMPMKTATANTEISSGWSIAGTLHVTANPGYGYLKLYQQAKSALKLSLLIFLGALLLLILSLRLTLNPLKKIEIQANEIASGNFTTIEKLPWTLEVKNVAQSMNIMSGKLSNMIARLNNKLASLTENLKRDPLTNLLNQATFNETLKQLLSSGQSGYAAYIKIDKLSDITQDKGHQLVDELLTDFSKALVRTDQSNISAYRLYGSEFALICPNFTQETIIDLADELKKRIVILGHKYELNDLVHIGIIQFERSTDFNNLFPAMIEAYEQARVIGNNAYYIKEDSVSSISKQDWKAVITNTINDKHLPEIEFTSQAFNYNSNQAIQVMEEAFTVVKNGAGKPLSVATFFAMAQEFNLEEDLDKCIVANVISALSQSDHKSPTTINLSMKSVASPTFRSWLRESLAQFSKPESLVFSLSAYAAEKDLTVFANFNLFIHSLGAKVLLKRYTSEHIPVDLLKELHIDYIRLTRDLTTDIDTNRDKEDLLAIIHDVTNLLNIDVIAEDVTGDNDFKRIKEIGVYGIGR